MHAIAKVTWTISHLQPWYIYLRLPYLILLKYISIKIAICTQNKTLSFFSHRMSGYYSDRWNPCLQSNVWLALYPLSMSKRQKEKNVCLLLIKSGYHETSHIHDSIMHQFFIYDIVRLIFLEYIVYLLNSIKWINQKLFNFLHLYCHDDKLIFHFRSSVNGYQICN